MVLGLRGAKNIGIYRVFCSESGKKYENTTYVTIFRAHKNATIRCVASTTTTTATTTTRTTRRRRRRSSTKMRQKDVLQAAVWKAHHTVLCTCAHALSTWATPTLTLLYITLMAPPVCEALQLELAKDTKKARPDSNRSQSQYKFCHKHHIENDLCHWLPEVSHSKAELVEWGTTFYLDMS